MKRFFQKPHNLAAIAIIILTLIIASAAQNGAGSSTTAAPTQSSRSEQGIQEAQHTSSENAAAAAAQEEERKAIRDDTLQRAAGYAEAEDYKMATAVLNEALKKLPSDEELTGVLNKYQSDNRIIVRTYAISAAKVAADSGNYAEALTTLNKAQAEIGEDVEFSAMHANYADIYRQQLRDDAKKPTIQTTTPIEGEILGVRENLAEIHRSIRSHPEQAKNNYLRRFASLYVRYSNGLTSDYLYSEDVQSSRAEKAGSKRSCPHERLL